MESTAVTITMIPEVSLPLSNESSKHLNLDDIKMDSNFAMLLCSLVFAVSWVIYITYYNSRVVGYIITKVANKLFIGEGYFRIGSLTMNALSGKIMFRDLIYITNDYTIRVQDGYLIFRWWRSYVPKDVSEDLSHSDTRLSVMLNVFELHVYNRSELYARLEKLFGLDLNIFPNRNDSEADIERNENEAQVVPKKTTKKQKPEAAMAKTWRDLIPVIKCDVSSSRIVFGNRLIPTTLSITFEESHFVYSTKPAVCTLDRFMHFVKCKAENVKVMLAPSMKYTGMLDDPPRYMGEGFVLMSSNDLELYFFMDEPGLVPEEPVLITLANGEIVEPSPPQWGVDIKCGKGTDFSYGPWADRQREHLFKFFYPPDFLPMEVTQAPKPGDGRQMQSFDIRLLMQTEATIDILFTKDKETNAVHVNVGAGSYLEVTIPWVTTSDGYTTSIKGQLLHLEATTSLQFRDFVESETLEFCVLCHYPLVWNDHQLWEINLTGCKATVNLIFFHKWFFTDLINDWASKQRPDLIHFVPYTWRFGLTLKHCELLTLVNQYNWIDCSSVGQRSRLENTQLALCAHFLHLSFDLPFDEFLPETVPVNLAIQGESIDLSLFIPEFHTSRNIVMALEKYAKVLSKDGSTTRKTEAIPKWRNICSSSAGWVDFWWVPIGAISLTYTYHPSPPVGPQPQADISTPVKEEILLSPIRFPRGGAHARQQQERKRSPEGGRRFDPTSLAADRVNVELEIGPSVLLVYGTALRNFMNFKENIFGEDQSFTDMQQAMNPDSGSSAESRSEDSNTHIPLELREDFDHRYYRPLEVDVSIIMHDVQAHLLKNCTEKDPPCPVVLVERVGFEMKKRFDQTELQLLISPAVLLVSDNLNRSSRDKHLNQGKLSLSSLQVKLKVLNECDSIKDNTLECDKVVLKFCGKDAVPDNPTGDLMPVLIHSCPSNFSTVNYFGALETEHIGRLVIYSDVMTSSHNVVAKPLAHGLVVIPRQQTQGIGRSGNVWLSPLGCAMFSMQLHIPRDTTLGRYLPLVQQVGMVAVVSALRTIAGSEDLDVGLKWPNDLYANGSVKIGGLLITSTVSSEVAVVNLGCGINLDNGNPTLCVNDMIRASNESKGTSMRRISYESYFAAVFNETERIMKTVQSGDVDCLYDLYYKYWLHNDSEVVVTSSEGKSERVKIVGIDEYGFLRVRTPTGKITSVHSDGNTFDMLKGLIFPKPF